VATTWGRLNLFLLRVICGVKYEVRGREKIPKGRPLLVAAKHQSAWETFALLHLFDDPLFIVKRELMWIPIFGWLMIKGRMVPVDRSAGGQALNAMTDRARIELADNRQLIIFPEGTRRAAGAEPRYKHGVVHLYASMQVPCVPVALNSGLFWPRRSILRIPAPCWSRFSIRSSRSRQGRVLRAPQERPRDRDGAADRGRPRRDYRFEIIR